MHADLQLKGRKRSQNSETVLPLSLSYLLKKESERESTHESVRVLAYMYLSFYIPNTYNL